MLVAVLVVVMLLSMLVVSLLLRCKAETTATGASLGTEQAWAAAMSGVEEALRVAAAAAPGATDWQELPAAFRDRLVFDDGAEQWFFSVFSMAGAESLAEFRHGLTDEASRLNVNTAHTANLEKLPRLTPALVAALRDFIDPDNDPRPEGAEQEYYSGLPRPYAIRNGPLASFDELLLVRGFTPALLRGATPTRVSGAGEEPTPAAADARTDRGIRPLLTVHSYDVNRDDDGIPRTNLNDPNDPLPEIELPPGLTNFLAALRANNLALPHAADLLGASIRVKSEKGVEVEVTAGIGREELPAVLNYFTAENAMVLDGLVNVNTASVEVLAALPGVDESLAEAIVSTRRSISPERRTTIAWLFQEGVVDAERFKAIAPALTARSFQFTFQVVGYGLPSGRFRVFEVGVDVAAKGRRITYLRDVTRLGVPFPLGATTEPGVAPPVKGSSRAARGLPPGWQGKEAGRG